MIERRKVDKTVAASSTTKAEVKIMVDFFSMLAYHWKDEKEYEDFGDYVNAMEHKMPKGAGITRMNQKPFYMEYHYAKCGTRMWLQVKGNQIIGGEIV